MGSTFARDAVVGQYREGRRFELRAAKHAQHGAAMAPIPSALSPRARPDGRIRGNDRAQSTVWSEACSRLALRRTMTLTPFDRIGDRSLRRPAS
jgi:hypothetical protein